MKIGVYGGVFDPPHKIHKQLCMAAAGQFALNRIVVLPTATPPHKQTYGTPAAHRMGLAKAAFCEELFCVSDLEQKKGFSYTFQSLQALQKQYPDDTLFLIVGGDSLRELHTWKNPEIIASTAKIIAVSRGEDSESEVSKLKNFGADISFCKEVMPDVSSTTIRSLLEFGIESDMIEDSVKEYIQKNQLYTKYQNYTKKLRGYVDGEKYIHSAYTFAMGDKIARYLKLDEKDSERVRIACILHDCAKQMTGEDAVRYGLVEDKTKYQKAMHGFLGEIVAKQDFGITDEVVLEAIRFHTTAAPDMSKVAKIVLVADTIEESREYSDIKYYQNEAFADFEEGFRKILIYKHQSVLQTKKAEDIHPYTKKAYEFYCLGR